MGTLVPWTTTAKSIEESEVTRVHIINPPDIPSGKETTPSISSVSDVSKIKPSIKDADYPY